jgi:hypothetical protein
VGVSVHRDRDAGVPENSITTPGDARDASRNDAQECRRSWSRTVGVNVFRPISSSAMSTPPIARGTTDLSRYAAKERVRKSLLAGVCPFWRPASRFGGQRRPTTDTAELQERQVPDVSSRPDRQFLKRVSI